MTNVADQPGRARKKDNTPLAARPELLALVHPDDRERAARLSAGSPEVVRWLCPEVGHYAPAEIRSRVKHGRRCVYCTNKAVLAGFNDVATKAPDLLAEWHPTRNGDKQPHHYTFGSPEIVWWLCSRGHEWEAQIRHRVGTETRKGTGCRDCKGLRRYHHTAAGDTQVVDGKSVLAAWPGAAQWWAPENPVGPDEVHETDPATYAFCCPEGHRFAASARAVLNRKRRCLVCTGREVAPGVNTLDVTHPAYASEWDEHTNGLPASQVTWANRSTYFWTCPFGHSYPASVRGRIENGTGCAFCEGRAVLPGFNDLATVYPEYLPEWDDERDPSTFYKHSSDSAGWRCADGHRWSAKVVERVVGGTGCPFCDGKRPVVGVNDLFTTDPDIAAQWAVAQNGDLTPQDVTIGSGRSVWWRIEECGHTWRAPVRNRTSADCAPCARGVAITGVNDVLTTHPGLGAYFDATTNPGEDLAQRKSGSGAVIAWACPTCSHRWDASIRQIVAMEEFCPRCSGREPTPGVNDAATLYPHLLAQVDTEVQPADILVGMTAFNGARIPWRCEKGHKWSARLNDRVRYDTGCPECAAQQWTSAGEDQVAAFIESLGFEVQRGVWLRPDGQRHNYDIFIPDAGVYVEYNGLYFHSEATGKGRDYHATKLKAAQDSGATLLTVWEDDWLHKRMVVERFLAHKLGRANQPRTAARSTTPTMVDPAVATLFLDQHHIQGAVGAGLRFGLEDKAGDLVAVMLMRIEGNEATIVRYATSRIVPGGFTKLLRHAQNHLLTSAPGVARIKTFSDNLISDGSLYAAAGFVSDGQVPPDYAYFRGRSPRLHKFNLRINRFKKDPTLAYEEGLSERELAALNGFHRIWDAGKTRWLLPVVADDAA